MHCESVSEFSERRLKLWRSSTRKTGKEAGETGSKEKESGRM